MAAPLAVVVLAAGRGVRMRSSRPKVLHEAAGRPLLGRVLATAVAAAPEAATTVVVVGAGRDAVEAFVARALPGAVCALQEPPRGTGDAVRVALPHLGGAARVLVLSGDVPLLRPETVGALVAALDARPEAAVALLTAVLPDGGPYGRVVRDGAGAVVKIVEAKDATEAERAIREVNAGVYAFDRAFLADAIPKLTAANAQAELYLTDLVALAVAAGRPVAAFAASDADEMLGVNSRAELARVDALLRARAAERAMAAGATLIRPETISLDDGVDLDLDVVVEPFVSLLGATRVGAGTRIGQGTIATNAVIGRDVVVRPYSVIESAVVGDGAVVGPFARLREGTELGEGVHVGNFVETKKARLGKGVKANHLTYLGDTTVGERTNVGAGVITCNYDGFDKHPTTIGRDVFVGSDTQLVAPVVVGDGAMIGAGTTVTDDVPADALAVSRAPQKNVAGYAKRYREKRRR